jgi:hypothetical protein
MAQYVRLAQGIAAGEPVETPRVTTRRYVERNIDERPVPGLTLEGAGEVVVADGTTTTVAGSTDARRVYLWVNGEAQPVGLRRNRDGSRTFSVEVQLTDVRNKIVVVAEGRRSVTAYAEQTVLNYGARVGGLTDPVGDDNGPGTYTYPTNPVYVPGAFDLTAVDVFDAGADLRFVTTIAGEVTNPFGGQAISHQRVNLYLTSRDGEGAAPALPGTNVAVAAPWDAVLVVDGRYGPGLYGPDGTLLAPAELLAVPETRQIVATVPRSAFGDLDPVGAGYAVAMFGNAEAGEGVGNIRPVYDPEFWAAGDPSWVTEWRFGGGAGVLDDSPAKDTDTRDPNAIDIVVGEGQQQADVMNWQEQSPVTLPVVPLDR